MIFFSATFFKRNQQQKMAVALFFETFPNAKIILDNTDYGRFRSEDGVQYYFGEEFLPEHIVQLHLKHFGTSLRLNWILNTSGMTSTAFSKNCSI